MNIALLHQFITVQVSTVIVDDIGNHKTEWEDFYSCSATPSGETGEETDDAGTTVDNEKLDFTIRWCEDAAKINPTNYRVIFRDELYDILSVDHMGYKNKCVKLKCRKARRL